MRFKINSAHSLAQLYGAFRGAFDGARGDIHSKVQDNTTRLDRLELLLIRTSMADFAELDSRIEKMLPVVKCTQEIVQPDVEPSQARVAKWILWLHRQDSKIYLRDYPANVSSSIY